MRQLILSVVSLAVAGVVLAGPQSAAPALPKEFDRVRKLVGAWEGTTQDKAPVRVEYSLTAGGTAVVERLMPGTPHEMLSVYYVEDAKVRMTHYCVMGNRPNMELRTADDKVLRFELAARNGLTSPEEHHMHAVSMLFSTPDAMTQTWVSLEKGEKKHQTVFDLKRVR